MADWMATHQIFTGRRRRAAVGTLVVLTMLAGCSSTGSLFRRSGGEGGAGGTSGSTAPNGESIATDTRGLAVYLETMQQLIEGDTLTQAAVFSDLEDAAEFAPTTTNRLLYALALSLPDHGGSDPAAAAERLRDLIAAGNTLLPEERMLAQIQLKFANELAILQDASAEYDQRIADAVATRDRQHATELQEALAENERLEAELKDVTATLDAITNIERSLSEREDNEQ
jgi:hypothetical protein